MEALIMSLVSGAVGGNVAGGLMKNLSLGTLGNSVVGILGGGIGGQILGMLGMATGDGGGTFDMANIAGSLASGGVGGGALLAVVGVIKKAMGK